MVLPNALLFPHALLPLYIFEPRYREMVDWALNHERMFCVALMKPGVQEASSSDDFHQVAGIGLVRACVGKEDGTSHLVLQGLARVRFTAFSQEAPFRIAEITEMPSLRPTDADSETLCAKVLELCARHRAQGVAVPESLDQQLAQVGDPDMLADVVAHTFLQNTERRQAILSEARVDLRLRALIEHMKAEMGSQ